MAYDILRFELKYFAQTASGEWLEEEKWLAAQKDMPETERRDFSPNLLKVSLSVVDPSSAHHLQRAADWDEVAGLIGEAEFPQKIKMSTFQTLISLK